jgi:cell division protein FtsI (penicillin-binding protein 3)
MSAKAPVSFDIARWQRRTAAVVLGALALLFAGLVGRLIYIDTVMAPRLRGVAIEQQEGSTAIPARRGTIFDARGRVMAVSEVRNSVFVDPALIEHPDETARTLAPLLHMDAGEIENEIRTSRSPRFCWLKRLIDNAEARELQALKLPGVGLREEFERRWPMNELAAHVVGFTGADGVGLEGLEASFNSHLQGVDGSMVTVYDARRRPMRSDRDDWRPPVDGGHVVLTIDSVIQSIVEQQLREQVEQFKAECGVAVVLSVKTGEVLAMACCPTYDPNNYQAYPMDARRNRVVTDPVEAGSTFKPFVMSGALAGKYVRPTDAIDCHNGLHFFGKRMIHDTKQHGVLSPKDIIVYSSNIGMGVIGTRMGNPALYDIITRFGYGSPSQVGLSGESEGIVLPLKQWTSYSTTSVPMGQELAVTPMQLVTAFGAIVNKGVLLRPRILKARLAADGSVIESFDQPEVIRRVIPEDVARYMTDEVLPAVVKAGGKDLELSEYTMCGKTGTAQVPYKGRRSYEPNAYLSCFVGAAPVEDPQIAVLVMIRKPNPSIGYYGRVVSGPAVRDVVRATLEYLGVPPSVELAASTKP